MQHLAIIPDGNRRWAKNNKLKTILGHEKGTDAFESTIKFCIKNGIKYLSFYAFSLENFNRGDDEKSSLFNLMLKKIKNKLSDLIKQNVKISFIGDKKFFPESLKPEIEHVENETKNLETLNVNLLFCYGAQAELVNAAKSLAQKVKTGAISVDSINEKVFENHLWTAGIPNPDLIIRTSGITRLSNFLLYQAAYSEFMFLDCYWPEITETHLDKCLKKFKDIQRNFGR